MQLDLEGRTALPTGLARAGVRADGGYVDAILPSTVRTERADAAARPR